MMILKTADVLAAVKIMICMSVIILKIADGLAASWFAC